MAGWEVDGWSDAWLKVVGAPNEDYAQTDSNVESILGGYAGANGVNSALEIGAGYGRLVKAMRKRIPNVYGVDSSQALLDLSKEYLGDLSGVKMLKGNGSSLPIITNSIDFVYSYIAFQHMHTLEIIQSYVTETFRVLKSGGTCRIQTVKGVSNPSMVDGGLHRCHLFKDEKDFLKLFLDAGFKATVEVGVTHFQHIWVTGRKP
jgi:SAM-dependent methyltransferase